MTDNKELFEYLSSSVKLLKNKKYPKSVRLLVAKNINEILNALLSEDTPLHTDLYEGRESDTVVGFDVDAINDFMKSLRPSRLDASNGYTEFDFVTKVISDIPPKGFDKLDNLIKGFLSEHTPFTVIDPLNNPKSLISTDFKYIVLPYDFNFESIDSYLYTAFHVTPYNVLGTKEGCYAHWPYIMINDRVYESSFYNIKCYLDEYYYTDKGLAIDVLEHIKYGSVTYLFECLTNYVEWLGLNPVKILRLNNDFDRDVTEVIEFFKKCYDKEK